MTQNLTVAATVTQVDPDPERRDPQRPYLVALRVRRVLAGDAPTDRLTVLVHSPARTFADPDPVGSSFVLTLTPPFTEPYLGPLEIEDDPES